MRHVLILSCLILLNILLTKANSDYREEEDEELKDDLDDEESVDVSVHKKIKNPYWLIYQIQEAVHAQRMKKRAWNSGFTGYQNNVSMT